jgi:pyrroline-5-carboxylate reductase
MKDKVRIAFIGGGNMAEAIISSIILGGLISSEKILVSDPSLVRRDLLSEKYGVAPYSENKKMLVDIGKSSEPTLIVIAIKPQQLNQVIEELNGGISEEHVVLSIVAGVKIDTLINSLKHESVIRVMPNTPAQIGRGMSVWTVSDSVSDLYVDIAREMLQTLGLEILVDEEKYIDMATALSASGPAYVFMFLEAMIDAGVYIGLSREMSSKLATQTILGSIELVNITGTQPAELRAMVTSPGGTTAEAIFVLEKEGFRSAILTAVNAAYKKAILLGNNDIL